LFWTRCLVDGLKAQLLIDNLNHASLSRKVLFIVKKGSESSSSDSQALSYVYKNGLDDGLSLELGALIDTEDLMKDRTLSIRLVKSIADNIQISGLYQMSKSYEDANNGSNSKLMVFGLQYTF